MSSSPLFIRLALSTEIFGPMLHFGCASASARVALAMRSALHSRNGPPEAVIVMQDDFGRVAAAERLENGVVLGIERQQRRAVALHRADDGSAGADQRLLVGERDDAAGTRWRQRSARDRRRRRWPRRRDRPASAPPPPSPRRRRRSRRRVRKAPPSVRHSRPARRWRRISRRVRGRCGPAPRRRDRRRPPPPESGRGCRE